MHKGRNLFSLILPGLIAITLALVAACSPILARPAWPAAAAGLEILPILRPYYQELGGEPILGPVISTAFILDGADCQYTFNALLCKHPGKMQFFLAPLGRKLQSGDPSRDVLDGNAVDQSFLTLYQKLGGAQQCGQPISQLQTIPENGRIQQHFENVGFYRSLDDPQAKTRLLPYGAQSCGSGCASSVKKVHSDVVINTPFAKSLQQMAGSAAIFGEALSEPYLADEAHLEQVYATVLVTAPLDQPEDIDLKPLAVMLGMPAAAPSEQVYGPEQNMVFYPVAGSLGYHIPVFFTEFIDRYGGMEVSGRPLSEPVTVHTENLARQCFENFCLDYHLDREPGQAVSLSRLGSQYLEKINPEEMAPYQLPGAEYLVRVGETKPRISSEEPQEIFAMVFNRLSRLPAPGIEVRLTVLLPDNTRMEYLTPPTDQNGFTSVEIAPITGANNSTLVSYQACLNLPVEQPVCASDAFMIWNVP